MSGQAEVVLAYWSEQRQQMRQSEDQRAVLTNYVLVIASALAGLAVQQGLTPATLPLTVLITLVGVYGAVTVAKYHERAAYHLGQARALTAVLKDLGALPADETLLEIRRAAHYQRYRRLHRLRLHLLWTSLHLVIAGFGFVLSVVVLVK
jgi:type IV secretory pathway TrbF-like protein